MLLEVFLAALEHGRFPALPEKEQQVWLWAVARNKVVDHYRRLTRHSSVTLKQVAETVFENDELAPEQVILRHEEYAQLHATLKELPALQIEVIPGPLTLSHGPPTAHVSPLAERIKPYRFGMSRPEKLFTPITAIPPMSAL